MLHLLTFEVGLLDLTAACSSCSLSAVKLHESNMRVPVEHLAGDVAG